MTQPTQTRPSTTRAARADLLRRQVPLTDMPAGLMGLLVAAGLPRTVLADLGVVEPEGSLLYYVLALAPFAAWLGVAVRRRSRRPLSDFVVLGACYGLSLAVVHQVLWDVGSSLGHRPPAAAADFADAFTPALQDLAVRGYTVGVAMLIGVGTGLVVGLVAKATARRHR